MTIPGAGGQVPPRPDQQASPAVPVPVSPGSPAVIRARQVIIVGANGELLVYNPVVATGDLAVSIAGVAGTGLASDTVQAGVTVYASGGFPYAQLNAGVVNFQATAGQFSPGVIESFGVAGEVGITSGLATNTDSAANIIVDSATASGIANSLIALQAARVTLNSSASSNIPDTSVNPGHNSAAPAAYSQSYEQANTNRINQILDILAAVGIWPF